MAKPKKTYSHADRLFEMFKKALFDVVIKPFLDALFSNNSGQNNSRTESNNGRAPSGSVGQETQAPTDRASARRIKFDGEDTPEELAAIRQEVAAIRRAAPVASGGIAYDGENTPEELAIIRPAGTNHAATNASGDAARKRPIKYDGENPFRQDEPEERAAVLQVGKAAHAVPRVSGGIAYDGEDPFPAPTRPGATSRPRGFGLD